MITSKSWLPFISINRILINRLLSSKVPRGDNGNEDASNTTDQGRKELVNPKQESKPFKPRGDWLPAERPWELGLPDHMKPQYPEISYGDYDIEHPKVSDEFSREEMHPMQARYRYPQFDAPPPPLGQVYEKLKDDNRLHSEGKMWRTDDDVIRGQCDIVIIGGGMIGTAIAYMLKRKAPDSFTVMVIEKDMTVSIKTHRLKRIPNLICSIHTLHPSHPWVE